LSLLIINWFGMDQDGAALSAQMSNLNL